MVANLKVILEGDLFRLVKHTNRKSGRIHYTVMFLPDARWAKAGVWKTMEEVRDLFDPARNRGSKTGLSWKFSNRKDAEQLITIALMKWSSR